MPGAPTGVTAFVDVTVVPMDTERALAKHTVLVQDGWITALGPSRKVPVPAGATRIDGRSKYLVPGLSDCHAHLNQHITDSAEAADEAERRLALYVAHGVTTIRNVDFGNASHRDWTLALRLRARAAAGTLVSPRIYTSGYWPGPGRQTNAVPPESLTAVLTRYKAAGFDFVKLHDQDGWNQLADTLLTAAVVTTGRRVGIPVLGHVPVGMNGGGGMPLERVLALGFVSIEHLLGYTGTHRVPAGQSLAAQARATQHAGVWNCPTLAIAAVRAGMFGDVPTYGRVVKALQEAGAGLLLGTDAYVTSRPNGHAGGFISEVGVATALELHALVAAGLTPYQALRAGTWNMAQYLGALDSTGTVAVGKRADLVLLAGNPLQNVLAIRRPVGVMLGGRWLPRTALKAELVRLMPGPAVDEDYYLSLIDTTAGAITATLRDSAYAWTTAQALALRQLERGLQGAPRFYWADVIQLATGAVFAVWAKVPGRSTVQEAAFSALFTRHTDQQGALANSLQSNSRGDRAAHQRVRRLLAQQLSEFRSLLTPEHWPDFDRAARQWERAQARQGYPVTIPGLAGAP